MKFFYPLLLLAAVTLGGRFLVQLTSAVSPPAADGILSEAKPQNAEHQLIAATGPVSASSQRSPATVDQIPPAIAESTAISPPLSSGITETGKQPGGDRPAGQLTERTADGVSEPMRHQAAGHPEMLTPGNFEYLGGFRPPHTDPQGESFAYGGWGIACRPDGNPQHTPDQLPGSLFLVGAQQRQLVAEITIPRPLRSPDYDLQDLPVAEVLQPLADITGGIRSVMTGPSSEPFQIGGLQVVADRLHWTIYKYYNTAGTDYCSHGRSSLNLARPEAEGLWHLGPVSSAQSEWHSYKHAGYIAEIPAAVATQWFGGRQLMSGLQIATGLSVASHGPSLFAYQLPEPGTPHGSSLAALPLVCSDIDRPAAGFHPADRWTGAAWLTHADKQAVIVAGRKALGPVYYGEARPQDCTPDKGYHGTPYEAQLLFYTPAALISAAHQQTQPFAVAAWYTWNADSPGGSFSQYLFPTCDQHLGGIAYDRRQNLLYVCQVNAGTTPDFEFEYLPVIHVFRIVD